MKWLDRPWIYRAPHEMVQCPACGAARLSSLDTFKLRVPIDGRRTGLISGCEDCGLVFVNPPPTAQELFAMYDPSGEWAAGHLVQETACDAPRKRGLGTWVRMFDAIKQDLDVTLPPAGARALDFGCGRGKFLDVLQNCGWETYGLEPAMDAAFERHHRVMEIPAEPTFDLLVAHHVLEHLTDPLSLLRQLAGAAKPGAYLVVATPRLDTLAEHRDRNYVISRVHVTAYTAACMEGLLARAGWRVIGGAAGAVKIAGGRLSTARLRLVAKRDDTPVPSLTTPLDQARAALAAYQAGQARQSRLARIGGPRVAARLIESRRMMKRWTRAVRRVGGPRG